MADEWYTPAWIFDAAGIEFDLDPASPVDAALRTCPAKRHLSTVDDGLTAPWSGSVWMNPPYSKPMPWVERFVAHGNGIALLPATRCCRWLGPLLSKASAITLLSPLFDTPDGKSGCGPYMCLLVAHGMDYVDAVKRVAAADRYNGGAYHVAP